MLCFFYDPSVMIKPAKDVIDRLKWMYKAERVFVTRMNTKKMKKAEKKGWSICWPIEGGLMCKKISPNCFQHWKEKGLNEPLEVLTWFNLGDESCEIALSDLCDKLAEDDRNYSLTDKYNILLVQI